MWISLKHMSTAYVSARVCNVQKSLFSSNNRILRLLTTDACVKQTSQSCKYPSMSRHETHPTLTMMWSSICSCLNLVTRFSTASSSVLPGLITPQTTSALQCVQWQTSLNDIKKCACITRLSLANMLLLFYDLHTYCRLINRRMYSNFCNCTSIQFAYRKHTLKSGIP